MERTALDRYIEPPPRLCDSIEALPHLGGLALMPYRGELPDEVEQHAVEALRDDFDQAAARELLKRVLALSKVRDRLQGCRHVVTGIVRRGDGGKDQRRTYLAVAYDYNANVAIEITLDSDCNLASIVETHYQPPLVEVEVERAIDL